MKAMITKGKNKNKTGNVVGVYMDGRAHIRIDRKVQTYRKGSWVWK